IQLVTLGIIGEYVGRIYHETKSRPHYVIHVTISRHGWSWSFGGRRAHITGDRRGPRGGAVRLPGGFTLRRDRRRHH
ncbi:DUF4236 domain-containing protein, partial [Streptomyces sp. NPDC058953]|uniref:DUF4236 domain-containing protein n=1 Tax=Streptomyces sp. NPDC058953 TaxID=3346676 RepID=UPI00369A1D6F